MNIQAVCPNELFYEVDETFLLGFDQFYDLIKSYQESALYQKAQPLNLEEFLAVQISDELKFYLVKRCKENKFSKELIRTNPLGLDFFDKLNSKILGQKSQKNQAKKNFAQLFQTALNDSPDLLVKDIYGPNSSAIGLPENLLASSFGKLAKTKAESFGQKQILRSLVMSIAINTAQISGLLTIKHSVSQVVIVNNRLNSLAFNRYFATILKCNNAKAKLYVKPQSTSI